MSTRQIHTFDHLHIEKEIVELHQFFQDWFNGDIPADNAAFTRLTSVLAPNFKIITPDGQIIRRDALLQRLQQAHQDQKGIRIWIEDVRVLQWLPQHVLVTYQEWQESENQVTVRQSSALFQETDNTPNGWRWLHVHETWRPESAQAAT